MNQILEILDQDGQIGIPELAALLGESEQDVLKKLDELTAKKVILGRKVIIDWAKAHSEKVTAWVEVQVTPQNGKGFDEIAMDIARRKEVKNVFLMSGRYDLAVMVEGKTMNDISRFIYEILAGMEGVMSTSSHFIMRAYKEQGILYENRKADPRKADIV